MFVDPTMNTPGIKIASKEHTGFILDVTNAKFGELRSKVISVFPVTGPDNGKTDKIFTFGIYSKNKELENSFESTEKSDNFFIPADNIEGGDIQRILFPAPSTTASENKPPNTHRKLEFILNPEVKMEMSV
jgi:hypothetical protein